MFHTNQGQDINSKKNFLDNITVNKILDTLSMKILPNYVLNLYSRFENCKEVVSLRTYGQVSIKAMTGVLSARTDGSTLTLASTRAHTCTFYGNGKYKSTEVD